MFVISKWPRDVLLGWLDEVFAIGQVDVAVHVRPVPDRLVVKSLTDRVVSARSQLIIEVKKGSVVRLSELEAVIRDLEGLQEAIQTNRDRMLHVTVVITVWGRDEEDLDNRSKELENILARKAAEVRPLVFRQLEGFKNTLPVMTYSLSSPGAVRNLTLGGAMACLPVTASELSHPSGAFLGFTSTGAPVFFDPFVGPPWLPNPHVAAFGYTGSGKSVTLKLLIGRLSLAGVRFVVFDPEGEYRRPCRELWGGEVITLEAGVPAGVNPLDLLPEKDPDTGREVVNVADKVADVRALVATIARGFGGRELTPQEVSLLEAAVRELYSERGVTSDPESLYERGRALPDGSFAVGRVLKRMPRLSDLAAKLERWPETKDLRLILDPFLEGSSLGMFDCETDKELDAPVVVFDLSRIKDEFTKLYAMFVVLTWCWHRFALRHAGKKMVVLDEAWMFAKWPDSAKFLETLARRGRKHRTGLVVASQHIEEFLAREEGRAVISSCATRIILGQNPTVAREVAEAFRLPAGAEERLAGYANGLCLLVAGNQMAEVQVECLPYERQFVFTGGAESAQL
ncbi:AAA ATPase [Ammonifex degensii KC4]|uniref:AAA ATPase n=1 Tax=Ammonifex degensii (strain DSM 10501 / KC4) TaxID=429009 RepID=C9RCA0_AMMDK|nr:AAA ATPase [Ammonifex degensii KC4]